MTIYEIIAIDEDGELKTITKHPVEFKKAIDIVDIIRFWDNIGDITIREVKKEQGKNGN